MVYLVMFNYYICDVLYDIFSIQNDRIKNKYTLTCAACGRGANIISGTRNRDVRAKI